MYCSIVNLFTIHICIDAVFYLLLYVAHRYCSNNYSIYRDGQETANPLTDKTLGALTVRQQPDIRINRANGPGNGNAIMHCKLQRHYCTQTPWEF